MRAYLRPYKPKRVHKLRLLPSTPYLKAWQVVHPIEELKALIDEQRSAAMTLDGDVVRFQRETFYDPPFNPYDLSHFSHIVVGEVRMYPRLEWPGYLLMGSGDRADDLIRRTPGGYTGVDAALRHLPRPYRTIGELGAYVVGGQGWDQSSQAMAEWYAPLEARLDLDATDYRAGTVRYRVVAGSRRALRHTQVFVHPDEEQTDDLRPKTQLPVASLPIKSHNGLIAARGERDMGGESAVTLTLHVGREPVQWHNLRDYRSGDRNARLVLYEVCDPDAALLHKWLFPTTSDHKAKFEIAVGRLFVLAGFQVDILAGDKRLDDGVDVLAHDVAGARCLAIECTTGSINAGGKTGKLVKRLGELRRATPDITIIGVLVTSCERGDLSDPELQAAGADGLCVVDANGLRELINFVQCNTATREVVRFIEQCRPIVKSHAPLRALVRP